jgi:protein involved in polysaccharide export with SLBB domain
VNRYMLVALLMLTGCAPRHEPVATAAPKDVDIRLRPGDVVRLQVWREPEMSGEYRVDPGGQITLPRIGHYDVRDETAATLHDRVLKDYAKYLRDPSIRVTVLRTVKVMGAVRRPGVYDLEPTATLADAIATAGGADEFGVQDRVELVRDGERREFRLDSGLRALDVQVRSGDSILVPQRNWLSRNAAVVATAASATVGLIVALIAQ